MLNPIEALRQWVADSSVITKITLLYFLAIILPSVSLTILSYHQAKRGSEEKVISTHDRIYDEVYNDLLKSLHGAEVVGDQLSFNTELRSFLSSPYDSNAEAVLEYTRKILPIVVYAQRFRGGDIDGIKIFFTNRAIPEHWFSFLDEERLLRSSWYEKFRDSDNESMWLYPNDSAVNSPYMEMESHRVISYARKIYDPQRKYLGAVVVDLSEETILANLSKFSDESGCFGILSTC